MEKTDDTKAGEEVTMEQKIVFAMHAPEAEGKPSTLIVGIPAQAWEFMKAGKTHNLDLTKLGVPVQLMLFGADDHEAAMTMLKEGAAQGGITLVDARQADFSVKEQAAS